MHLLKNTFWCGTVAAILATASFAADHYIVRIDAAQIDSASKQYGFKVEKRLHPGLGIYRIAGNATAVQQLLKNGLITSAEPDSAVRLPELASAIDNSSHKLPGLAKWTGSTTLPGQAPWLPYLTQPANTLIRLADAQKKFGYGSGSVIVAVIDTGVDYNHPILRPVVNWWDGTNIVTGGSDAGVAQETSPFIDQETSPFIDAAGNVIVAQETSPFIDQETSPFIDNNVPAGYGHGTMVAGIVHLVAPFARILPITAFSPDGSGQISDVIAAIYYAVDHNASVLNMSFSAPTSSAELQAAIAYATSRGVICVASVANDNSPAVVYPAGVERVIGIASTNYNDYRSAFSNYGSDVTLAAPGEAIMTTYPQNRYALGWGTSFATPYVTGTVALLKSIQPKSTISSAIEDLTDGSDPVFSPGLGAGRLDVYKSAKSVK